MNSDETPSDRAARLLAALTPADRLLRALALSAYVRALAWQGAHLHSGASGADAVRDRFLEQLYGSDVAGDMRARLNSARVVNRDSWCS